MSAIRPDLPAVAALAARPGAGSAQAAFFRAALGEVAPARPAPSGPARSEPAAAREPARDPVRGLRPGALLDIRV